MAVAVSDATVEEWTIRLAKTEGIFAEPSGAAGLAGLHALIEDGIVDRDESVVVPITGSGFKDMSAIHRLVGEAPVIPPRKEEVLART